MSDEKTLTVTGKLLEIQRELKVPKNQFNSFGGYKFRSKEDILEAVKPLAHDRGCVVTCSDNAVLVGGWVYVETVATMTDAQTMASVTAVGLAREQETRKGMDASQITGTASSYSGKRALGNLLALDDTADADVPVRTESEPPSSGPFTARCRSCGTAYRFEDRRQYEAFVATATCCPNPDWRVD